MKAVVFSGFSQGSAALYGGHVDLAANPHSSFLGPLREGRIRVVAVSAPQIAYRESRLRAMAATDEWKQTLEKRAWVNRYAGPKGCSAGLKRQYDQMRRGLVELGLAKS